MMTMHQCKIRNDAPIPSAWSDTDLVDFLCHCQSNGHKSIDFIIYGNNLTQIYELESLAVGQFIYSQNESRQFVEFISAIGNSKH